MTSDRSALFRVLATALAILVIVFGLAAALGGLGRAAEPSPIDGKLIGQLAVRLPVTLEPVLISFFVASALGFVLTLSLTPGFRGAVSAIVTVLQSLPFFVLAIAVWITMLLELSIGPCAGPTCTLSRQLAFLLVPVVILTTYQLPFLVEFFDSRRARGQCARVDEMSTISGLALLFADRLPSLIGTAMIGEIIYGWTGEGGWLGIPNNFFSRDASAFVIFLVFNALVVLAIRCIVELLVHRRRPAADVRK